MTQASSDPQHWRPRSIADLRLCVTLNHFKRLVLGDEHLPGVAQGSGVFQALDALTPVVNRKEYADNPNADPLARIGMKASRRSWESWFDYTSVRPKSGHIAALDEVAKACPRWTRPRDDGQLRLPEFFYAQLYEGGLLTSMLSEASPKRPRESLRVLAEQYKPKSAWHLHLDALELLNFAASMGEVDSDEIVKVAGARIFDLLYALWGDFEHPGILDTVYAQLSSEAHARWDAKSDEEKREDLAHPLLGLMDRPERVLFGELSRKPDFRLLGRAADVTPGRIYRMLFAIGSDSTFLQGAALHAWAMDLATAGAAAVALFYAGSPYLQARREQIIVNAIDSLMLGLHVNGVAVESQASLWGGPLADALNAAMLEVGAGWSKAGAANLLAGRRAYEEEMASLGVRVTDIYNVPQRKFLRRGQPHQA